MGNIQNEAPSRQWLKTDEAAAVVGLSIDTIREAIKNGRLRAYRPGGGTRGHFLISSEDLDQWVRESPYDLSAKAPR